MTNIFTMMFQNTYHNQFPSYLHLAEKGFDLSQVYYVVFYTVLKKKKIKSIALSHPLIGKVYVICIFLQLYSLSTVVIVNPFLITVQAFFCPWLLLYYQTCTSCILSLNAL